MNICMEKYLPIGSVVHLINGEKTLMIYGRKQVSAESEVIYDYVSCPYPEGDIDGESYLFNHSDIRDVMFTGYINDEEIALSSDIMKEFG